MSIQTKEYHKAWRDRNKDKTHAYYLNDYAKRKEKLRLKRQSPEYRKNLSEYLRQWRKDNAEKRKESMRIWAAANKDYIKEYRSKYGDRRRELYRERREEICARKRELAKTEKYRKAFNERQRKRRITDIQFSLADRLRASVNRAFRRNWIKKPMRTEALIGCSIAEAKAHIEKQFAPGMSWQSKGAWHIDHYVPIVAFDLTDPEERLLAFNWKNLRPITARENHEKSDTLPDPLPDWLPAHIRERILSRCK